MRRGDTTFAAGDPVVFIDDRERDKYATLKPGKHTDISGNRIQHDDVIGGTDGMVVRSSKGRPYHALKATMRQHVLKMSRHAQIVYPKDVAVLLTWADVYAGQTVIEGGLGSGALTMALLQAVGPEGRVVTYELREEAANRALKNVRALFGDDVPWHELRIGDIYEGIAEEGVDRILLDVPEPWDVVPHAAVALRDGGIFASYVPTVVQLQQLSHAVRRTRRFTAIESLETILRPWYVSGRSVRPEQRIIGHTGFLLFARKVASTRPVDDGGDPGEAPA